MKKFLSLAILLTALLVGGCGGSGTMETNNMGDNRINIKADNADGSGSFVNMKIDDGTALKVDAKISSGKLVLKIENKEHEFDKTGEFFVDLPAGEHGVSINSKDGLTGEIALSTAPKN